MADTVKMTPELEAALIKLRDADAKLQLHPGVYSPRTREQKAAAFKASCAADDYNRAHGTLIKVLRETA